MGELYGHGLRWWASGVPQLVSAHLVSPVKPLGEVGTALFSQGTAGSGHKPNSL